MPEIVFGLESYESRSLPLSAQRLLNCFLEAQPQGTKSQVPIFGAPGLTLWTTLPTSPIRGLWNFNGTLYVTAGNSLYRVNNAGGYKLLGTGITGTGVVSMSDNGTQVVVSNGVEGYLVDDTDHFQQIIDPNFYSANSVLYFDNYFVFDRKGTNEFFLSALGDGLSYNGLDFASAEAQPGLITAVAQNLQLLFIFCQNHIEMWYDAGTADFPFQRYAGGVIERGCVSPHTIILQDDAIFFLGVDRVFYRLQGNVPIRMSTHAVEHAFAGYGDISDAFCFTYTLEGHKMVCLQFPSVPHTWEFDISTRKWHERESWDANNQTYNRWRGNCAIEIYNHILIGDAFSGKIGILDWDNNTEYGNILQCSVTSSPIHADRLRVFIGRLELDMQAGVGLTSGQGSNPKVWLSWSKDGARTWSKPQLPRSIGKIGEYVKRQRWLNLGSGYQFVLRVTISDPVQRVIIGTHADVEVAMP
jgi:hypothetical protein